MIQPRSGSVGLNSDGTSNFGVGTFTKKSKMVIEKMAMITEKSLTN